MVSVFLSKGLECDILLTVIVATRKDRNTLPLLSWTADSKTERRTDEFDMQLVLMIPNLVKLVIQIFIVNFQGKPDC